MTAGTDWVSRDGLMRVLVGAIVVGLVTGMAGPAFVGAAAASTGPSNGVAQQADSAAENRTDAEATGERHGILRYEGFEDAEWEDQFYSHLPDPASEAGQTTTADARAGERSMQLRAKQGWDYSGVNSVRSEISTRDRAALDRQDWSVMNEPFWVGFSFRTPATMDTEPEGIFEFHRDISENPRRGIMAYPSAITNVGQGKPLAGDVKDGNLVLTNGHWTSNGGLATQRERVPLQPNTWYDVVAQIKWSDRGDGEQGFIRVWVNGVQVMDFTGDNVVDEAAPRQIKFGVYKYTWANGERGASSDRAYLFDEIRYGSANSDYASVAPGSGAQPQDDSDDEE